MTFFQLLYSDRPTEFGGSCGRPIARAGDRTKQAYVIGVIQILIWGVSASKSKVMCGADVRCILIEPQIIMAIAGL